MIARARAAAKATPVTNAPPSWLEVLTVNRHFRRLVGALLLFALIHGVGTIGYLMIGGAKTTTVDALYMTFITVATIGYGEVVDLSTSPGGRVFTMAIAFAGIGTLTYVFSTVTAFMLETNLNLAYRRRQMHARIDALRDHFIVCGAGRVGGYVIEELDAIRAPFVVVETEPAICDRMIADREHRMVLNGDAADDELLVRAGIARARGVFAVTGDDAKNLVISLSAKQLNARTRVVARIHDQRNAAKTLRAGADEIVSPDFTGGRRIASLMLRPHVVSLFDELLRADNRLQVEEVLVPAGVPDLSVGTLGHSSEWLLVAVREGSQWQFNPEPSHPIRAGQALLAIASAQGRRDLVTHLGG